MHLDAIAVYPVKSLGGVARDASDVDACGLAGDRRWMVVDDADRFVTRREVPAMARLRAAPAPRGIRILCPATAPATVAPPGPDAPVRDVRVWRSVVPARDAGDAPAALLSRALGRAVRLVWMHDAAARRANPAYAPPGSTVSFADGYPLLLATTGSLDALNARLRHPVPMARFRANMVVSCATPFAEDRWRRVRIGEVVFAVCKPCSRCVVVTQDDATGDVPDGPEPLATLATFRRGEGGVMFGQNLVPETGGTIRVGDRVTVLAHGPPNVPPEPGAASG